MLRRPDVRGRDSHAPVLVVASVPVGLQRHSQRGAVRPSDMTVDSHCADEPQALLSLGLPDKVPLEQTFVVSFVEPAIFQRFAVR